MVGHTVGFLEILLAQASGKDGVDADSRSRGHRNHQILRREGQGNRRQGVLV